MTQFSSALFWILFFSILLFTGFIGFLFVQTINRLKNRVSIPTRQHRNPAAILQMRYQNGEISVTEYKSALQELQENYK